MFSKKTADFLLPGPAGQLEVLTTWPEGREAVSGVGIICHPHPLHQGTMRNKVVTTIANALDQLGLATVRFNYRGVGKSEGQYGHGQGEVLDLLAVKAWVEEALPGVAVWLAGFSFGAFIAANVTNESKGVAELITVAPAVNHADFTAFTTIHCPWLLIQGDRDEIVPYEAVRALALSPPSPLTLVTLKETSHFFHGRLAELQAVLVENKNKN